MSRYDSKRKPQRNAAVVKWAEDHPDQSYAEIAVVFGISRQRAFEIIKNARARKLQEEAAQAVPAQT